MLEGSGGSFGGSEGGREFSDQSVRSESVEEVDVSRRSREDCRVAKYKLQSTSNCQRATQLTGEWKSTLSNVSLRRLLVGVGTISEGELLSSLNESSRVGLGSGGDSIGGGVLTTEVVGNGRVVSSGMRECLHNHMRSCSYGWRTKRTLTAIRRLKSSGTDPFPAFHRVKNSS